MDYNVKIHAIFSSKSLFSAVGGEQEAMKTDEFHLFLDRKPNKQKAETLLHPACCEKAHGVECETFSASAAMTWETSLPSHRALHFTLCS